MKNTMLLIFIISKFWLDRPLGRLWTKILSYPKSLVTYVGSTYFLLEHFLRMTKASMMCDTLIHSLKRKVAYITPIPIIIILLHGDV